MIGSFARSGVSALTHIFLGAVISGTFIAVISAVIYLAYADHPGDAFFAAMIFGFLASIFGAIAGFFVWGIRGWISTYKSARAGYLDYRDDGNLNGSVPPHRPFFEKDYTPATPIEGQSDPWRGQNPYGCCRNHTDTAGNPSHGGPGCQHPNLSRHL